MKCFYALVSEKSAVLSVIQWDTTYPGAPKVSDGTLVRCHADVQAGQVFDKATGKFAFPAPVKTDVAAVAPAPAPASISEVAAELAQVEKSVQVLMTQK
jgi:hypothetical protein